MCKLETCIDDERQFKRAKRSQAPGDATVRKQFFFHDNFVIFRHRSKRIAFLESVNFSTCVYKQVFNFRNGDVTTFRHHLGANIFQMPGHRLFILLKRHTFRASAFHQCYWFGVKLFPVGCVQDSRRAP